MMPQGSAPRYPKGVKAKWHTPASKICCADREEACKQQHTNPKTQHTNVVNTAGSILGNFFCLLATFRINDVFACGPNLLKPTLKTTWLPSCFLQASKPTTRPRNKHFASIIQALCFHKSTESIGFLWFLLFLKSQPMAASLPSPESASRCPVGLPKEGQGGPKMAQDGPKMGKGRHTTSRATKIIMGSTLGPSWATSSLQNHCFYHACCFLGLSNPYDPKYLSSHCFASVDRCCSQHGFQASFRPSNPQQDLKTNTVQAIVKLLASRNRPTTFSQQFSCLAISLFCHIAPQNQALQTQSLFQDAWAPKEGPRQEEPKMGPKRVDTQRPELPNPGLVLGPTLAHLGATFGLLGLSLGLSSPVWSHHGIQTVCSSPHNHSKTFKRPPASKTPKNQAECSE